MTPRNERSLISYIPWTKNGTELLNTVLGIDWNELEKASLEFDVYLNNRFIVTMDEDMIAKYEALYGIEADPANETLSFRRARLINRWSVSLPYTTLNLRQRLEGLLEGYEYYLEIDYDAYEIHLDLSIAHLGLYDEILNLISVIKPANMELITEWNYNTWSNIETYTWAELESYTWFDIATSLDI